MGGTEVAIHSINLLARKARLDGRDFILLQTDFTNAYNTIDRKAIFDAVAEASLSHSYGFATTT